MAVSKRLRYEILRRDNNTCRYCKVDNGPLTIDHVVPVALGGSDDPSNLVVACKDCNAGKSASNPDAPLVAAVDEKATQFALAVNRVIEDRVAKHADDREIPGRDLSENLHAVRTLTEVGIRQLLMSFQFSEDAVAECWEVFALAQQYMGTRFMEVDPGVPVDDALDDIVMSAMEDPAYRQPYLDLLDRIIGDGSLESG